MFDTDWYVLLCFVFWNRLQWTPLLLKSLDFDTCSFVCRSFSLRFFLLLPFECLQNDTIYFTLKIMWIMQWPSILIVRDDQRAKTVSHFWIEWEHNLNESPFFYHNLVRKIAMTISFFIFLSYFPNSLWSRTIIFSRSGVPCRPFINLSTANFTFRILNVNNKCTKSVLSFQSLQHLEWINDTHRNTLTLCAHSWNAQWKCADHIT